MTKIRLNSDKMTGHFAILNTDDGTQTSKRLDVDGWNAYFQLP